MHPHLLLLLALPLVFGLRGAHPSNATSLASGVVCIPRDSPSSPAQRFPPARVNDDYCHCLHGEDEPGTSACPGTVFWCSNAATRPRSVPSSWVDDGSCDCCDGSDEASGDCPDTCAQDAAKMRREAEEKTEVVRQGVRMRKQYAKEAGKGVSKDQEELRRVKKELKEVEEKLNYRRKLADGLRKRKEYEEMLRKARETPWQPPPEEKEINDAGAAKSTIEENGAQEADAADQEKITEAVENDVVDKELDVVEEGYEEVAVDQAEDDLDDRDTNSMGEDEDMDHDFIDDDSDLDGYDEKGIHDDGEEPVNVHDDREEEGTAKDFDVDTVCAGLDSKGPNAIARQLNLAKAAMISKLRRFFPQVFSRSSDSSDGSIEDCIRKADSSKWELQSEVSTLKEKIKKLSQKEDIDYGPDGALRKLHGSCTKKTITQYEFELCPFDLIRQYEHGSAIANLGRFSGWNVENGKKLMSFTNGDSCWNGPSRSTQVELLCGTTEDVVSVEEPNRCTYKMQFQTPAVCETSTAEAILATFDHESADIKQEL